MNAFIFASNAASLLQIVKKLGDFLKPGVSPNGV